ncbi:MAG: glycosyltransferase [Thermodesulfobacteriota bacterium]|nr:glycosyltransferase [Thermodesulfobacteriota bacterium]
MRICYIADGQYIHTHRWLKAFRNFGHEVHLISDRLIPIEGIFVHNLETHGRLSLASATKVIPYLKSMWHTIPKARMLYELTYLRPKRFVRLQQLINLIRPDIVHAHYLQPYGFWGLQTFHRPFVVTCWGSDLYITLHESKWWKAATELTLRSADLVTCDSQDMLSQAIRFGASPKKSIVIQWGVETSEFCPDKNESLKKALGWTGHPVVLSTRMLHPLYNVDTLIEAIPEVIKYVPKVRFLIISDGEQRDALIAKAEQLGLSAYTKFLGRVDNRTLLHAYQMADIFVSIPSSDGTAVSLLEAMACGLPAIVTDLPSNREWIQDGGNGFLVPVRDARILSEKLVWLLQNTGVALTYGSINREIILKRAEHIDEMRKMEGLYQSLLGNKGTSTK